jgi:hypothetical protein
MQKISLYLVPNRIAVTTDLTGFTTELRTVYTRKLKLYRGINNDIEFDVRNSQSKKQSIVGKTPRIMLFDTEQQMLLSKTGELLFGTIHLFKVTFTKEELSLIDKQMLTLAAVLEDGDDQQIVYGDSQFGMHIPVELLEGVNDRTDYVPEQEITVFNRTFNVASREGRYTSELASFAPRINDDSTFSTQITIYPSNFRGTVTIEGTNDKSTASSNFWKTAATVEITTDTPSILTINGPYQYIRIVFPDNNTGSLDKVTVRN